MWADFLPQNLSLQQYLLRVVSFLLVVGVHGYLLAALARFFGDKGTAHDGRLTPNPLVHLDLIGGIAALLYRFGWMKPMRIDHDELRGGRAALAVIAVLACALTIAVALAAQLIKPLLAATLNSSLGLTLQTLITTFGRMGIWFALLNLVPLPPLTGGHILTAVSPAAGTWLNKHLTWTTVAVALLIVSGLAGTITSAAFRFIADFGVGL